MSTGSLSALLQGFFTDRLLRQLRASQHTVAAYRDTFRLLLRFAVEQGEQPSKTLRLERLDATFVGQFLDYLETKRGNTARTRNMRLAAIRSFFRYVAICEPAWVSAKPGADRHNRDVGMMAQVVEPDGADLANRAQLEVALRAAPRVGVGGRLLVPAPLAPALVDVPRDDAGPAHRPPEHELQLRRLTEHFAVRGREDEIRG